MKNLLEGMEDKAEEVFQKREQRRSKKSKKKRTLENQYRCSPSDYQEFQKQRTRKWTLLKK